jgi:hypothetical protein
MASRACPDSLGNTLILQILGLLGLGDTVIQLPIAFALSDQLLTPKEAIAAFGVMFTVLSYAYPDSVGGVDIISFYFFIIYI